MPDRAQDPSPDAALLTPRLRLRALRAGDAPELLALDADPEVRRYVHLPRAPTAAEVRAALPGMLSRYPPGDEPAFRAAEERETGRFVGWFHLRPAGLPGALELGYRLRREAWGRGYATEGAAALVERAFTVLGARRVEAATLAGNAASIRVLEKAGLRRVGSIPLGGGVEALRYVVYDPALPPPGPLTAPP